MRRSSLILALVLLASLAHAQELRGGTWIGTASRSGSGGGGGSITSIGTLLSANNGAAATTWSPTTSAALEVGNLAVCILAKDETGTGTMPGDKQQVTRVTDAAGNQWYEGAEACNERTSTAADGACSDIFYTRATNLLASGAAITFTFSASTTRKAATCHEFSIGGAAEVWRTWTRNGIYNDAADPGSMAINTYDTSSIRGATQHLFIRATACETNDTGYTADSDYLPFTHTSSTSDSGAVDTSMAARGEYRIATETTAASSDPTWTAADCGSAMIGLDAYAVPVALPIPGGTAGTPGATGWQHTGVTLASVGACISGGAISTAGGGYTLTTAGATYDGCNFNDGVNISANNITLKRSRIVHPGGGTECNNSGTGNNGGLRINNGPTVVEDVEITTADVNAVGGANRLDRTVCMNTSNGIILRRLYTHHSIRGFDFRFANASNIFIEQSYQGPNVSPPPGRPPSYTGSECPCNTGGNPDRAHSTHWNAQFNNANNIFGRNIAMLLGRCSCTSGFMALYPDGGSGSAKHDWDLIGGWAKMEDDGNAGQFMNVGCSSGEPENYNINVDRFVIDESEVNIDGPQNWSHLAIQPPGLSSWTNVYLQNLTTEETASAPAGGTPPSTSCNPGGSP